MGDRIKSVRNLLLEAVEIQDEQERSHFLSQACGPDLSLRNEVEELIRAQAAAGAFLPEQPASGAAQLALVPGVPAARPAVDPASPLSENRGDRIGR